MIEKFGGPEISIKFNPILMESISNPPIFIFFPNYELSYAEYPKSLAKKSHISHGNICIEIWSHNFQCIFQYLGLYFIFKLSRSTSIPSLIFWNLVKFWMKFRWKGTVTLPTLKKKLVKKTWKIHQCPYTLLSCKFSI